MGFDHYHEPTGELSREARTFGRMAALLAGEAEAISRYEQQLSVERDAAARAIMTDAQQEAFNRFGMDLDFLLRRKPRWKVALQGILSRGGDIVERGEQAEQASAMEATETLAEQEEEALPL